MSPAEEIVVIKNYYQEKEPWRYTGRVLQRTPDALLLTARFNAKDVEVQGVMLKEGDFFFEAYYTRRWFNIYEIRGHDTGEAKGWYCNITRPAEFTDGSVSYVDLALDLFVHPDGRWIVLDEDEFDALKLSPFERTQALKGVEELKTMFSLGADFHLDQIFPVTNPYEIRLRRKIAENGWKVEHLSFEESTHSVAEAARVVQADPQDFVKNICLITPDDRLVVAIVKGEDRVSVENAAFALGLEGKPRLASAEEILARTGYPMGGTPSFGFEALFLMDERVFEKELVYTGGGSPSSLVRADPRVLLQANRGLIASLRKS